ncbi:envelope stress response membrane protein PspB [Sphingomonas profundi]|uniref:envelope stress response membrane protein PspB n=1 Tax=Alterirhizorhabdus profundi TaxID=2681549 RepID=UPI0012E7945B|nr:envelope stress response membrane protein PspB [Sphingomonas profundi]
MEDVFLPIIICGMLFLGLPWLVFHYITQWKRAGGLSIEDENLLDELHDTARRLDDRLRSIERIVAADDPHLATGLGIAPAAPTEWRTGTDR